MTPKALPRHRRPDPASPRCSVRWWWWCGCSPQSCSQASTATPWGVSEGALFRLWHEVGILDVDSHFRGRLLLNSIAPSGQPSSRINTDALRGAISQSASACWMVFFCSRPSLLLLLLRKDRSKNRGISSVLGIPCPVKEENV